MSYDQIEAALKERDAAIMGEFGKLSEKTTEVSDRLASLEQKGAAHYDHKDTPPRPSLMAVIRHLSNPRDHALNGPELEWHQELAKKNAGASVPSGSVWIPLSTKGVGYSANTITTTSPHSNAGGSNLVAQELHPELIDLLRQESVVMSQGIRVIPATGDLDLPKKSTGVTGYWFGADGADSITESTPVFTSVQLRPKFVAGLAKVSYRMMIQTGGDVERIIAEDIAAVLAEQVDLKALQGTGADSQPTGVLNASISSLTWGGTSSPVGNTGRFWWEDALLSEQTLIDSKAYRGNLSWLCDSASWRIMQHQISSNDEHMSLVSDGRVLNYPIAPTTHMPANTVLFGNWQELVMAVWGGIALAVDTGGDNFAKGDTAIRAILPVDFAVRHAASFVKNVRP
jgi:HK97 family phage major capsid protein